MQIQQQAVYILINPPFRRSGPGCSKLTTSLVNVSLKFPTLISNTCQYFLLKKCEKLFSTKISEYLVIKS